MVTIKEQIENIDEQIKAIYERTEEIHTLIIGDGVTIEGVIPKLNRVNGNVALHRKWLIGLTVTLSGIGIWAVRELIMLGIK